MTATIWAAVIGILCLFIGGWLLMRKAAQAERGRAAEETIDRAEEARRARIDPDALERVRNKYRR